MIQSESLQVHIYSSNAELSAVPAVPSLKTGNQVEGAVECINNDGKTVPCANPQSKYHIEQNCSISIFNVGAHMKGTLA